MADISQVKLPSDSTGKNIKALKLPYGECSTAASTAAKVVDIKVDNGTTGSNMPFVLEKGVIVLVRFTVTNTAAVANLTLSVNGTTAKGIKYRNANLAAAEDLAANRTYMFTYDGTYWQFIGDFNTNTDTKVRQTLSSDNANRPLLMSYDNTSSSTTNVDNAVYRNNSIYANASTGKIAATTFAGDLNGTINTATTATTQSQGDNSTKVATTAYVDKAIEDLPEPMVFRGSLGTGGTITSLPTDGTATVGDTYKVITAGTYASKTAKVGDTFICLTKTSSANTWELIPSGDEPNGTVTSITLKATSPISIDSFSAITTSGTRTLSHANSGATAGSYGDSSAQTPTYGGTFKVPYVTVNATGHVTSISEHTVTIPASDNTDTKVTSSANHYTPSTASGQNKTASASGGSNALTTDIVKGVTLNTDGKGHVTGLSVTSGKTTDVPYIIGTGSTAGTWLGTLDGLTAYYDGLLILYKIPVAGATTTTLNLNNLGAKTVYCNNTGKLTTHYPANQPILLVYSTSQNSGCWMAVDNYVNSNTIPSAYCESAGSTAAKAASCSGYSALANSYIHVDIVGSNTVAGAITLNINGKGAKPIYINGAASSSTNYSLPAGTYLVYYDGTNYYFRTDGKLTTNGVNVGINAATIQYNSTDNSIEFIFN